MRPSFFTAILVLHLAACVSRTVSAQESPTPYVASPLIQAEALDQDHARTLIEFLARPLKNQTRSALGSSFCKSLITQPTPSSDQIKLALALVESEVAPILSFTKAAAADHNQSSIHYSVEFGLDTVTVRSSSPRYQSQAAGLRIAYPRDTTRPTFFEGKGDMGVLFLVPPVRDCNIQFVLACPRAYSNSRTLDDSKLSLAGVTYQVSAKADGLFKAPANSEGKILAAVLASSRIKLPSRWFSDNVSSDTPSASLKIPMPLDVLNSASPFTSASLPILDAIEARLEFGSTSSVKRVVRSRATVEIAAHSIDRPQQVRVERSELILNPGSCIVISRRKESHY